ncbi:MAG: DUF362 domain-containing protein [Planctomycetota bacterium]
MPARGERVSRRDFLRRISASAAAGAGLAALPGRSVCLAAVPAGPKSRVVDVRSEAVLAPDGGIVPDVIEKMLNTGMMALTGKDDIAAAWREFVSPGDVVGLKFNGVSRDYCRCNEGVLNTVAKALKQIGVKEGNIIPIEDQLKWRQGAFGKPNMELDRTIDFGAGKTQLKKYLTEQVDVLINVPDLKDHDRAGVTLALKNVSHGVIGNPGELHDNNCDPYIGYINALPVILRKRRLNICNCIRGIAELGPMTNHPQYHFVPKGFLISTDPVALDAVGRGMIEEARKKLNLPPYGDEARHIETAASIGLGVCDPARIDLVKCAVDGKGGGQ